MYYPYSSTIELNVAHLRIPLIDIETATNNFAEENLIKRGGSADVYKGLLLRSEAPVNVVIWRFHLSWQQEFNFQLEIERLSGLNHKNLVFLIGFCDEKEEKVIVIEHVVNGSLDQYLGDPTLTWSQRLRICLGVALALRYWHRGAYNISNYHNFNSSKIWLDKDWEAKVCCFRTLICKVSNVFNRNKSDAHCMGGILFEVLHGRKATTSDVNKYATLMAIYDYREEEQNSYLKNHMYTQSLSIFSKTAYLCFQEEPEFNQLSNPILERLKLALELQLKHEYHVSIP
ncbi:putative protein kinase RLK-Pelle-L-LEC family [Helianthus annuus]|nr:putative protein kinase RLK-Pelle-L-LEC family [Helianthus annuus]